MKKLLTFCLLLLCSGSVIAKEKIANEFKEKKYLCTDETKAGLVYDEKKREWEGMGIPVIDRYEIKITSVTETGASVMQYGGNFEIFSCNVVRHPFKKFLHVSCSAGMYAQFNFHEGTLRFMRSSMAGYLEGDKYIRTPHIAIGTCTPL